MSDSSFPFIETNGSTLGRHLTRVPAVRSRLPGAAGSSTLYLPDTPAALLRQLATRAELGAVRCRRTLAELVSGEWCDLRWRP